MRLNLALSIVALIGTASPAFGQGDDPSLLSVHRIYGSAEFRPEFFGPARWLAGGAAYTTLEPSKTRKDAQDIVRYNAETGARDLLVTAERLVPAGDSVPLEIEDYSWSGDEKQLMLFTNSQPLWRQNSRGDY